MESDLLGELFWETLENYHDKGKFTWRDLSDYIFVSDTYSTYDRNRNFNKFRRYKHEKRLLNEHQVRKVAQYLNISYADLFTK